MWYHAIIVHKKWFNLLGFTMYMWFWNLYTNSVSLTTLNDKEIVMIDDLFRIVTSYIYRPYKSF